MGGSRFGSGRVGEKSEIGSMIVSIMIMLAIIIRRRIIYPRTFQELSIQNCSVALLVVILERHFAVSTFVLYQRRTASAELYR